MTGKRVIGVVNDIVAVNNAFDVYSDFLSFSTDSKEDLAMVQKRMMTNVIPDDSLGFRNVPVGILDRRLKKMIYRAPEPELVVPMVESLFEWYRNTDLHPLVSSAVMHSQIEHIHPFADGNGRTGRFWHKLILTEWNAIFLIVPFEYNILKHRKEYYDVLQRCNNGDCTEFINYSLNVILEAVKTAKANRSMAQIG